MKTRARFAALAAFLTLALRTFTLGATERYRPVFQQLSTQLPQVADQIGIIVDGYITEDLAEYFLEQETPSGKQGFLIYLLRGSDGTWRISQL